MSDVLAKLKLSDLAAWYRRLADAIAKQQKIGNLTPLSSVLMREWLRNRDPNHTFIMNAPNHLRQDKHVVEALEYHRAVYLTEDKARLGTKAQATKKWAGLIPRLQGKGYTKWNGSGVLSMHYEGNVEIPVISTQLTGTRAEIDVLYGMGTGFQLRTMVEVTAKPVEKSSLLEITFKRFDARIRDRYDWNKIKKIKVPNPDYGVNKSYAVAPKQKVIQVHHENAIRLEKGKLAAPFDIETHPWKITAKSIAGPGRVDPNKSI